MLQASFTWLIDDFQQRSAVVAADGETAHVVDASDAHALPQHRKLMLAKLEDRQERLGQHERHVLGLLLITRVGEGHRNVRPWIH